MEATSRDVTGGGARLEGWAIVGWAAAGVALMTLAVFAVAGTGEDGMRMLLRATARSSAVLFSAAFAASGLQRGFRAGWTRWLLTNRRYLGVSFAVSHLVHLGAIIGLARASSVTYQATTIVLGGFGFVLVAAMTATSFDATAAMIGRRAWKALHTFGVYYLWVVFFATSAPKVTAELAAIPLTALLLSAMVVRLLPSRRA